MRWAAVLTAILALASAGTAVPAPSNDDIVRYMNDPLVRAGYPMSLGCEREGIRLDLAFGYGLHTLDRIRVSQGGQPITERMRGRTLRKPKGGRSTLLRGLDQLKGLVRIDDAATALRFVRLKTSLGTYSAWPWGAYEVEIVTQEDAKGLPDFGLGDAKELRSALPQMPSGWLGVLSVVDYRAAGFEPAKVRRVPGGFEVTRWVFWRAGDPPFLSRKTGIQQIREFVGRDGAYRRETIREMGPQTVPQLHISIL